MTNTSMKLTPFKKNSVAAFGQNYLIGLIQQAGMEEDAAKMQETASQASSFLGFEMVRAIFTLATDDNSINLHSVFGGAADVRKLNTKILVKLGIFKRRIDDDDVVTYDWTNDNVQALYEYTESMKEKDAAKYETNFKNRKRLNGRLSDAYKIAALLQDRKLSPDDLIYEKNDNGEMVPVIKNAPKEISGGAEKVMIGQRKVLENASLSPTLASLTKLAKEQLAPKKPSANDTKGKAKTPDAKMGINDEDFGRMCNNLISVITAQEGTFSTAMKKNASALAKAISTIK